MTKDEIIAALENARMDLEQASKTLATIPSNDLTILARANATAAVAAVRDLIVFVRDQDGRPN